MEALSIYYIVIMNIEFKETIVYEAALLTIRLGKYDAHYLTRSLPIEIFDAVILREHFTKLSIIDKNGFAIFEDEQLLKDKILDKKDATQYELKRNYYDELSAFTHKCRKVIAEILSDNILLSKFTSEIEVKSLIIHDITHISKLVDDLNDHTNLIELGYCYILHFSDLMDLSELFACDAYSDIQDAFNKPDFRASFSSSVASFQSGVYNNTVGNPDTTLALTDILAQLDHADFNDYALLMIKLSNLLAYADDYLSVSESKLLSELQNNIIG